MGEFKGFMNYSRKALAEADLKERLSNYEAFQHRFCNEEASEQGARCMECGTPFCQTGSSVGKETVGCPIGNYIPEWNDLVYKGQFKEAYRRLMETNNFPEFTGNVCPAPCESSCVLSINSDPVAIKGIERTIIDEAFEQGWVEPRTPNHRLETRIAIIGSGPAGMTAADEMNAWGHNVDVYERDFKPGGLLRYGIPNMKLDKAVVERRVELMEAAGVNFICDVEVGKDVTYEELDEKYDAIIVATGARKQRDLKLEGRQSKDIQFAMDYLTEQIQYQFDEIESPSITAKDKHVIVIGGGDTGADCVAMALREGCKSVFQLNKYDRLPDKVDGNPFWPLQKQVFKLDYAHAEYESRFGQEPRAYGVQTMAYDVDLVGDLNGIQTQVLSQQPLTDVTMEDQERYFKADLVLLSIGFEGVESALPKAFQLHLENNRIAADDHDYKTNRKKVFAAGDARRGQSLVVWAIKEGREVARAAHKFAVQNRIHS
ncbi:glutamate synthase subunit beta [Salinicoccus sp. ID82-1]|uniref:glutamate synthase subunit beta n=1 Tax=Salinicoccus sp. ID82-1 TaxID=2820269 RepID=UPI001F3CACAA|nr:glutamate synthase subunit beta [Salinicoccus sp. ID82-1]MCG1009804.1 glutamate synthase subunit beta [Salinicoccus sp. ID82-1]